jgi:ABC-type polysaccharide/polyol phosphate export permease
MAGVLLNTFFNHGTWLTSDSISMNSAILTKIYVRPELFTISAAISAFINFMVGLIPLSIVVIVSGQSLSITLPLVVFVGISMTVLVTGLGLFLSTLFVRYDDTRNIVGVFLMIALYITPVFYPISILSPEMQTLINANPITSYLEIFRWAFSNNASPTVLDWLYMFSSSLIIYFLGAFTFKRYWPRTVAML